MKKLTVMVSATVMALLVACGGQVADDTPKPVFGDWGVDLTARNMDIKPGDDFYRYSSGSWLDDYQLPPDKVRYGLFSRLAEGAQKQVKNIILDLGDSSYPKGTVEQKIGDLYKSYMNVERRNELGMAPVQEQLDAITAVDTVQQVLQMFANSDLNGVGAPIGIGGGLDRKDPAKKVLYTGVDGTNLPDRDFYLEEQFAAIRDAYKIHIATMLGFAGYDQERAAQAADNILALETGLAKLLLNRVDSRDANKTYNPYSYEELKATYPGLDWDWFVTESGLNADKAASKKWIIPNPAAIAPGIAIITDPANLQTWKDYMAFTLVDGSAGALHEDLEKAAFQFQGILSGQQKMGVLWKRGVGFVSGLFGEAIGEVYVKRHFPEQSKVMMAELVGNVRESLRGRINQLEWMTAETKVAAETKMDAFTTKIGYPEKFEQYAGLEITDGDLFDNIRSARSYARAKAIKELEEPVDRTEWGMTPQTVNAYYNPVFNEIVFPAAILQAPFFDPLADAAANYGAIGVVIGHEMSHGFDDQGRKSDGAGVLRDWWNKADAEEFKRRADQLVAQFNQYEAVPGHFVDGEFTLGENIGDLGGVMIAYDAYKRYLNGREDKVIDGFTGDQRFFLAYAQVWRGKTREQRQIQLLKSDPHSPGEFRVNGIVRNVDAWYEAFNVQPGDALYLPPEQRVRIW
ncbi:M13 family metallopeptidase [Porticoccus sp. W117]|uniref:M13 family metallopeptidase n=1 Tax=Porticoccus sp. W117 TaxID=3054777 RepID=UPI00259732A7|nr:M13 family metallopeptidase [Porticoccus sp. W117]MDM3871853.1 M13 family metallopeptidase [Porticoccus sp. W117]